MKFYNKLKWILGIMIVFVLIVTTNLIDRNNFIRVKGSVETLYEDRLKANDLLFDLSQAIQEKEVAILKSDTLFFSARNAALNREIQTYIDQYEQTQLTSDESRLFNQAKRDGLKETQ
ncbi:MAG: MCP four helix bundle domain-containing protein, partial [Flavobacteriales bacterium]|nr:MCP four helix bundle domain-containing protein [Flavobacteriales bacterium]